MQPSHPFKHFAAYGPPGNPGPDPLRQSQEPGPPMQPGQPIYDRYAYPGTAMSPHVPQTYCQRDAEKPVFLPANHIQQPVLHPVHVLPVHEQPPPPEAYPKRQRISATSSHSSQSMDSAPSKAKPAAPPPKTASNFPRKRSHTACDTCRLKKIKCDNVKPKCGTCVKNSVENCVYGLDAPTLENYVSHAAYSTIVTKLDTILDEIRGRPHDESGSPASPNAVMWDLSLTSVLRWRFLQETLGTSDQDVERHTALLLSDYDVCNIEVSSKHAVSSFVDSCTEIDAKFESHASTYINSFFLNCHTKIPFIEVVCIIEALEMYNTLKKANPKMTLMSMLEEFYSLKPTETVPQAYKDALAKSKQEDTVILQNAYLSLCSLTPVILMICAIGVLARPVSLDNIGTYENSMEERSATDKETLDINRLELSQMFVTYSQLIGTVFPLSLRANSLQSLMYHVLYSQYFHYTMNPSLAHEKIVVASNELAYYIQSAKRHPKGKKEYFEKSSLINRLYWTCFKLECETRAEFSPFIPNSNISSIEPPSSFLKIPDSLLEHEHSKDSIAVANRYDDQYSWFYYLTEIAVRKIDNNIYDELYNSSRSTNLWDDPEFARTGLWKLIIKYLNQLNNIVDSLTPQIKRFVLLEANVEQIYASIKRKAEKKKRQDSTDKEIFDNLNDFLIDEDLLLKAQSESVIFIKFRIVSSKLTMLRPLIYLFLHDQIPFEDILEAVSDALPHTIMSQTDRDIMQGDDWKNGSSSVNTDPELYLYLLAAEFNFFGDPEDPVKMEGAEASPGPLSMDKKFRPDDFSDLVIPSSDGSEDGFEIKDLEEAKKRILKLFVGGFVRFPEMNIPKLGLFRHPGSWYYIRNLFISVVIQFLIYKKVQQFFVQVTTAHHTKQTPLPPAEMMDALATIFCKDTIQAILEHALLITNYWKDERRDCVMYGQYIRRCLDRL